MSMRELTLAALAVAALAGCTMTPPSPPSAGQRYGIGRIATAEEIRGWDIDARQIGRASCRERVSTIV